MLLLDGESGGAVGTAGGDSSPSRGEELCSVQLEGGTRVCAFLAPRQEGAEEPPPPPPAGSQGGRSRVCLVGGEVAVEMRQSEGGVRIVLGACACASGDGVFFSIRRRSGCMEVEAAWPPAGKEGEWQSRLVGVAGEYPAAPEMVVSGQGALLVLCGGSLLRFSVGRGVFALEQHLRFPPGLAALWDVAKPFVESRGAVAVPTLDLGKVLGPVVFRHVQAARCAS